jgi:hypothetical protein
VQKSKKGDSLNEKNNKSSLVKKRLVEPLFKEKKKKRGSF